MGSTTLTDDALNAIEARAEAEAEYTARGVYGDILGTYEIRTAHVIALIAALRESRTRLAKVREMAIHLKGPCVELYETSSVNIPPHCHLCKGEWQPTCREVHEPPDCPAALDMPEIGGR